MGASDIKDDLAKSEENSESNQNFSTPKGLLAVVIIMGVMIVIGTAALLWVIIHRMMHPHADLAAAHNTHIEASQSPTEPALLHFPRHDDEQIKSVVPRNDGSVAVTLVSPQGAGRILVWVPEQARIIAEFDLGNATP